jgi:uncharacterized membrane protein
MSVLNWLEHSFLITTISGSPWLYPAIEVLHFFSFFVLVGTMAIVDLRILSLAAKKRSVSEVADSLFPWTWAALALAILTGFLMFATEATGFVANTQFQIKMLVFLLALVFALIVRRIAHKSDASTAPTILARVAAGVSLALWIGVILAATEIANYSGLG